MATKLEFEKIDDLFEKPKDRIVGVLDNMIKNDFREDILANVGEYPLPSKGEVMKILSTLQEVIYPGYFGPCPIDRVSCKYYLGTKMNEIYEELSTQIAKSLRHRCGGVLKVCDRCLTRGREKAVLFLEKLPKIRSLLTEDVEATLKNDPAAQGVEEVIFSYPGILTRALPITFAFSGGPWWLRRMQRDPLRSAISPGRIS